MELFKFAMGASVKDRLTGFDGVVIARTEYMFGYRQSLVQPRTLDDGKMLESKWVDEGRLELLNATIFEVDFPA